MDRIRIKKELSALRVILDGAIAKLILLESALDQPKLIEPTFDELRRLPLSELAQLLLQVREPRDRGGR